MQRHNNNMVRHIRLCIQMHTYMCTNNKAILACLCLLIHIYICNNNKVELSYLCTHIHICFNNNNNNNSYQLEERNGAKGRNSFPVKNIFVLFWLYCCHSCCYCSVLVWFWFWLFGWLFFSVVFVGDFWGVVCFLREM